MNGKGKKEKRKEAIKRERENNRKHWINIGNNQRKRNGKGGRDAKYNNKKKDNKA